MATLSRSRSLTLAAVWLSTTLSASAAELRFEVVLGPGQQPAHPSGRLLVVLAPRATPEPYKQIDTGRDAPIVLGRDVVDVNAGAPFILDATCAVFPLERLAELKAGDYWVQALLRCNPDLRVLDAPGNLASEPRQVHLDPAAGGTQRLELTRTFPPETWPDGEHVKFIQLESKLLSAFHGRPMFMRAAVGLPLGIAAERERRYPLRVDIGGYGQRCKSLKRRLENDGGELNSVWMASDGPRMVLLMLDGAGPLGDPYQVNSQNNGPYGDALTQELIPYVEAQFRCIGEPRARFTTGGSTGGWVSLALQVFYPDYFNGCWSFAPDGVDFRALQLIDIYRDENAYTNRFGFERPSKRTVDGDVEFTVRHECQLENVLGNGDSWTLSGSQWGAWNAVYASRGSDGFPLPRWNPQTGSMHAPDASWDAFDLRKVLEKNWKSLQPKLRGKIHIFVGDADDYFLNNAVVRLERFFDKAEPAFEGVVTFGWRMGHGYAPLDERQVMEQMLARVAAGSAK
jgi:hypothetical protein